MTWVAVAVGVGGAVVGAYGAHQSASAAKDASKGAGQVNLTTTHDPYGPSQPIRDALMQQAFNNSQTPFPTFAEWSGQGTTATGGSAAPRRKGQTVPAGYHVNAAGRVVPVRNPANAAAAPGGGAPSPGAGATSTHGISDNTRAAEAGALALAQKGNPLYDTAQNYINQTLQGNDQNAYRATTFDDLQNVNDPDLERLKQYLFGQLEDPSGGGSSSGYYGGGGGGVGTGAGGNDGPVGAASYIKEILGGKYLNQGNPYLEDRIKATLADEQKAFNSNVIPGLNSQYAGAGRFGGGMYGQALAMAGGEQARQLASAAGDLRFGDYNARMADVMQALGYGTQLDESAMQANAARAGAASSAATASQQLALQQKLGLISALSGAVGQGTDLKKFGLSGMAGLSSDFSHDQEYGLGATPDITGLSLRDYTGAGNLSLAGDKTQSEYDIGLRQVQAQRAAANAANKLARDQFNFGVYRDERGYPIQNIAGVSDIINALTGAYGTTTEQGTDRRGASPSTVSPTAQAISGGIAGGIQGWNWGNSYSGGGAGGGNVPQGGLLNGSYYNGGPIGYTG